MAASPPQLDAQLTLLPHPPPESDSQISSLLYKISQQVQAEMEDMLKSIREIDENSSKITEEIDDSKDSALEKREREREREVNSEGLRDLGLGEVLRHRSGLEIVDLDEHRLHIALQGLLDIRQSGFVGGRRRHRFSSVHKTKIQTLEIEIEIEMDSQF